MFLAIAQAFLNVLSLSYHLYRLTLTTISSTEWMTCVFRAATWMSLFTPAARSHECESQGCQRNPHAYRDFQGTMDFQLVSGGRVAVQVPLPSRPGPRDQVPVAVIEPSGLVT